MKWTLRKLNDGLWWVGQGFNLVGYYTFRLHFKVAGWLG